MSNGLAAPAFFQDAISELERVPQELRGRLRDVLTPEVSATAAPPANWVERNLRGVLREAGFMPLDEDKPSATQARRAKAASARLSRELEQERLRLQRAAAAAAAELEDAAAAVREATRLKAEAEALELYSGASASSPASRPGSAPALRSSAGVQAASSAAASQPEGAHLAVRRAAASVFGRGAAGLGAPPAGGPLAGGAASGAQARELAAAAASAAAPSGPSLRRGGAGSDLPFLDVHLGVTLPLRLAWPSPHSFGTARRSATGVALPPSAASLRQRRALRLPTLHSAGPGVWTLSLAGASQQVASDTVPITGAECTTTCLLDSDAVAAAACPWLGLTPEAPPRPAWLDSDTAPDGCGGLSDVAIARRGPWATSLRLGWTLDVRTTGEDTARGAGGGGPPAVAGLLAHLLPLAPSAALTLPGLGTCVHTSSAAQQVAGSDGSAGQGHRPASRPLVPLATALNGVRLLMVTLWHLVVPPPAQQPSRRARLMDYVRGGPEAGGTGAISPRLQHTGSGGDGTSVENPLFRRNSMNGSQAPGGGGGGGRALDANAAYLRAATKAAAAAEKLAATKASNWTLSPQGSGVSSPVETKSPPRSGVVSPANAQAFWRKKAASASAALPAPAPGDAAMWRAAAAAKQRARSSPGALSPENSFSAAERDRAAETTAEITAYWKTQAAQHHGGALR